MLRQSAQLSLPRVFSFEASDDYRDGVIGGFLAAVESGDPEALSMVLWRTPHCVEAAAQLAEYLRTTGQHEAAGQHLRLALYLLGASLHPSFEPWVAPVRVPLSNLVDGRYSLNRTLYTSLLRFSVFAGRRGCPEAAFEACRLLLSLQPEGPDADPALALLLLDSLALRAGKSAWVVEMTGRAPAAATPSPLPPAASPFLLTLGGSRLPLVALPGWALARSLALFRLECGGVRPLPGTPAAAAAAAGSAPSSSTSSSSSAALYSDPSFASFDAAHMLVRTLLFFPHLLTPLLREIGITSESRGVGNAAAAAAGGLAHHPHPCVAAPAECVWGDVLTHRLFADPARARDGLPPLQSAASGLPPPIETLPLSLPALDRLVLVAASLHAPLWKAPAALGLLFRAAALACAAYDCACAIDAEEEEEGSAAAAAAAVEPAAHATPASSASPAPPAPPASLLAFWGGDSLLAAAEAHTAVISREQAYGASRHSAEGAVLARYGGAIVSDFVDKAVAIGQEVLDAALNGPGEEEDGGGGRGAGGGARGHRGGRLFDLDLLATNPIVLFFQAMLPWSRLPGAPWQDERGR
jgi:hypothetical protein